MKWDAACRDIPCYKAASNLMHEKVLLNLPERKAPPVSSKDMGYYLALVGCPSINQALADLCGANRLFGCDLKWGQSHQT